MLPGEMRRTGNRVVVFVPHLGRGGAEKIAAQLTNGMSRRGLSVVLVVFVLNGHYVSLLDDDIEIVELDPRRDDRSAGRLPILGTIGYLVRLIQTFRRIRPDAIYSSLLICNLLTLLAVRFVRPAPLVFPTICDNLTEMTRHVDRRDWRGRVRLAAFRAFSRFLLPTATRVVSVSHGLGRQIHEELGVPQSKIVVIDKAPVVDDAFMAQRAITPSHRWFDDRTAPVLVALGRLSSAKDYPTLLNAVALVRGDRAVRLVILGEGEEEDALRNLAEELGIADIVDFAGFSRTPYPYLAAADVYVLSSRWECLPTALIEALACGARVVATRCPYGPDEILENGRWGRLVPVADADALAAAIIETLDEPTSEKRRAHFQTRHRTEAYIDAYLNLMNTEKESSATVRDAIALRSPEAESLRKPAGMDQHPQ